MSESEYFEYKFRAHGTGAQGAPHCTYCPAQPGEACAISCAGVYEKIKAERAADGVVVVDEPDKPAA